MSPLAVLVADVSTSLAIFFRASASASALLAIPSCVSASCCWRRIYTAADTANRANITMAAINPWRRRVIAIAWRTAAWRAASSAARLFSNNRFTRAKPPP